eukprot:1713675-Rhodomonas_salina.2
MRKSTVICGWLMETVISEATSGACTAVISFWLSSNLTSASQLSAIVSSCGCTLSGHEVSDTRKLSSTPFMRLDPSWNAPCRSRTRPISACHTCRDCPSMKLTVRPVPTK